MFDRHVVAGDDDAFQEKPHEPLAPGEVEVGEARAQGGGEGGEILAQSIAPRAIHLLRRQFPGPVGPGGFADNPAQAFRAQPVKRSNMRSRKRRRGTNSSWYMRKVPANEMGIGNGAAAMVALAYAPRQPSDCCSFAP